MDENIGSWLSEAQKEIPTSATWKIDFYDGLAEFDFDLEQPGVGAAPMLAWSPDDLKECHIQALDELEKCVCLTSLLVREIRRRGLHLDPRFPMASPGGMGFSDLTQELSVRFDLTRILPFGTRYGGTKQLSAMTRVNEDVLPTVHDMCVEHFIGSVCAAYLASRAVWIRSGYGPLSTQAEAGLSPDEHAALEEARTAISSEEKVPSRS
jgi:hypothetical protein